MEGTFSWQLFKFLIEKAATSGPQKPPYEFAHTLTLLEDVE